MHILESFFIGLQFLTRISIVRQTVWTEENFGKSVKFFPAIGAVLGLCYAAVIIIFTLITERSTSVQILMTSAKFPMIEAAIILMTMTFLTGAIHCDGFMDTFDGLFSGRDREKMLEIMKDSRVGAFGVVSFVMLSMFEFAILTELSKISILTLTAAIYSAPIIARLMMVITIGGFPYARPEGMGKAFSQYTTNSTVIFAVLETLILLLPLMIFSTEFINSVILALLLSLSFTMYFGKFAVKKIGGVTGDIYGAVTTISESIVLLIFLIGTA